MLESPASSHTSTPFKVMILSGMLSCNLDTVLDHPVSIFYTSWLLLHSIYKVDQHSWEHHSLEPPAKYSCLMFTPP